MDWLGRLFDITKLPSKFFAWAAVLTALFLFLPSDYFAQLHLDQFPAEYKGYAGVVLVGAISFLGINLVLWLWEKGSRWFAKRRTQHRVQQALEDLDDAEKSVLREFAIQGRHVIELPVDHPTVSGLMRKGIVAMSGLQGYRSLAGSVFPFALTSAAERLITADALGFPANPTETQRQAIWRGRPNFLSEIEKNDRSRGGLW